ncbi:MAG TPA: right-handed parallel beta-helix repeat-containing protein [Verrucomicrobiae bacterium]|nr:right-handed parallel beta-helix repeat-containing protein [Verrucomicrobiae bacterium]
MTPARYAILVSAVLLCSEGLFSNQLRAAQYYNDWAANYFSGNPAQASPTNDPDGDGDVNLVEFAFGTDPTVPGVNANNVVPIFGTPSGTNGVFSLQIVEQAGHQPGAQIDLWLNSDLTTTNWFRPWWLRTITNSQPGDPVGSVRENFSTYLPGTNAWFARASVSLMDAGVTNADYYVATNGSDSNAGTSNAPFATLSKAVGLANPGNLIYVRDGTYHFTSQVTISRNGTPAQPILARAFPGEHPVFDFTGEPSGSAGINVKGNCWQIYGLEVEHAGHNGILINGSSNVLEHCVVHESGDSGIHLTTSTALVSYNLVLNCDSYRNYDPPIGGNADGITAKFTVGPGNVFYGCRTWNNSDDGWDFWEATNAILVENCITFSNGFDVFDANPATNTQFNGNGNGFKMGGNYFPGPHHYVNCVSFGNKVNGFDQNDNTAGLTVDNCTAWANGGQNFDLNHDSTNAPMIGVHVVRNNLSIAGHSGDSFRTGSLLTNNSWQVLSPSANAGDVLSVDSSGITSPRRDDGSPPQLLFLRPVPGGRLVDKGVNTGQPFIGSAPDLGAYESPEW